MKNTPTTWRMAFALWKFVIKAYIFHFTWRIVFLFEPFVRRVLYLLPAETAHYISLKLLKIMPLSPSNQEIENMLLKEETNGHR